MEATVRDAVWHREDQELMAKAEVIWEEKHRSSTPHLADKSRRINLGASENERSRFLFKKALFHWKRLRSEWELVR